MSKNVPDDSRRRFLRGLGIGIVATPIAGLLGPRPAVAADKPRLDLDNAQAKALNYVNDAAKASGNSAFQEGSHCANCLHWQGGDSEWGGCNIFPANLVHRDGWCAAWAKQTG